LIIVRWRNVTDTVAAPDLDGGDLGPRRGGRPHARIQIFR